MGRMLREENVPVSPVPVPPMISDSLWMSFFASATTHNLRPPTARNQRPITKSRYIHPENLQSQPAILTSSAEAAHNASAEDTPSTNAGIRIGQQVRSTTPTTPLLSAALPNPLYPTCTPIQYTLVPTFCNNCTACQKNTANTVTNKTASLYVRQRGSIETQSPRCRAWRQAASRSYT